MKTGIYTCLMCNKTTDNNIKITESKKRKPLTKKDIKKLINEIRSYGLSDKEISARLGIDIKKLQEGARVVQ